MRTNPLRFAASFAERSIRFLFQIYPECLRKRCARKGRLTLRARHRRVRCGESGPGRERKMCCREAGPVQKKAYTAGERVCSGRKNGMREAGPDRKEARGAKSPRQEERNVKKSGHLKTGCCIWQRPVEQSCHIELCEKGTIGMDYNFVTLTACGPLAPSMTSYSTSAPSSRVLKPSIFRPVQ